jgi:hypothetical protein
MVISAPARRGSSHMCVCVLCGGQTHCMQMCHWRREQKLHSNWNKTSFTHRSYVTYDWTELTLCYKNEVYFSLVKFKLCMILSWNSNVWFDEMFLYTLYILWPIGPLLGNGSVNIFPKNTQQQRTLIARQRMCFLCCSPTLGYIRRSQQ